jgi:hypothetical protein
MPDQMNRPSTTGRRQNPTALRLVICAPFPVPHLRVIRVIRGQPT